MLSKYTSIMKDIFSHLFHSKGDFSITNYFIVIGLTIAIVVVTLFIIGLVIVVIVGPMKVMGKIRVLYAEKEKEILKGFEKSEYKNIKDAIIENQTGKRRCLVLYWIGVIALYIPITIPTVLMVIDLILRIF